MTPTWHLYLIRTLQGALYTGIATDVERRLAEHRDDPGRGAKYLRSRKPLELAYRVEIGERALAQQVEWRVKQLSKQEKEELVATQPGAAELFALLEIR